MSAHQYIDLLNDQASELEALGYRVFWKAANKAQDTLMLVAHKPTVHMIGFHTTEKGLESCKDFISRMKAQKDREEGSACSG